MRAQPRLEIVPIPVQYVQARKLKSVTLRAYGTFKIGARQPITRLLYRRDSAARIIAPVAKWIRKGLDRPLQDIFESRFTACEFLPLAGLGQPRQS